MEELPQVLYLYTLVVSSNEVQFLQSLYLSIFILLVLIRKLSFPNCVAEIFLPFSLNSEVFLLFSHVFLSQFYGDYMTVPSQEEIDYKSHLLQAYRKDEQ